MPFLARGHLRVASLFISNARRARVPRSCTSVTDTSPQRGKSFGGCPLGRAPTSGVLEADALRVVSQRNGDPRVPHGEAPRSRADGCVVCLCAMPSGGRRRRQVGASHCAGTRGVVAARPRSRGHRSGPRRTRPPSNFHRADGAGAAVGTGRRRRRGRRGGRLQVLAAAQPEVGQVKPGWRAAPNWPPCRGHLAALCGSDRASRNRGDWQCSIPATFASPNSRLLHGRVERVVGGVPPPTSTPLP